MSDLVSSEIFTESLLREPDDERDDSPLRDEDDEDDDDDEEDVEDDEAEEEDVVDLVDDGEVEAVGEAVAPPAAFAPPEAAGAAFGADVALETGDTDDFAAMVNNPLSLNKPAHQAVFPEKL